MWAKDAELVKRVRAFLGENFHWHERLAKGGADLDVVQTLMDMVRGGSVVVIPEKPPFSGGGAARKPEKPASSSFWGVENYDPPRYASVQERYLAQIAELQANETPWSEIEAMNDSINQKFMHAAVLIDPLGMLPTFARAGWISKYGLPDLSTWGQDADTDDDTDTLKDGTSGDAGEGDASPRLDDAQPFEYSEAAIGGETEDLAASTNNPKFAAKMLGYSSQKFRDMVHRFKKQLGIGAADDLEWHDNGDVYHKDIYLDNFHDYTD